MKLSINISTARLIVKLYQCHPLIFFAPIFIFGQLVGEVVNLFACLMVMLISFCILVVLQSQRFYFFNKELNNLIFKNRYFKIKKLSRILLLIFILSCGGLTAIRYKNLDPPHRDSSVKGIVDESPRFTHTGGVILSISDPETKSRYYCTSSLLPWREISNTQERDIVIFKGYYETLDNSGILSFDNNLIRNGYQFKCKIRFLTIIERPPASFIKGLREKIKKDFIETHEKDERYGLFLSLFIGIKDVISENTAAAFQHLGMSHLLVISGYQICLFFWSSFFLFKILLLKIRFYRYLSLKKTALAAAILSTTFFAMVCGFDNSCTRAFCAITISCISRFFERQFSFLHSILFSILIISVLKPASVCDPGIQLTYAALFGILLGTENDEKNSLSIINYFRTNLYISLLTSIVSYFWFDNILILALFLNPFCSFIMAFIGCYCGLVVVILGLFSSYLKSLFLDSIVFIVGMFRDIVLSFDHSSYLAILETQNAKIIHIFVYSCIATYIIGKRIKFFLLHL